MPNIRISDSFNGLITTDSIGSLSNGFRDAGDCRFHLMKGTIPLHAELDASGIDFRSADRLLSVSPGATTTISGSVITLAYIENNASATGTATWFFWDGNTNQSATGDLARLVGNVTNLTGGGDLKIADVNIISGNLYGVGPVTLTVPQSYTY